jgi:hypothetical protein
MRTEALVQEEVADSCHVLSSSEWEPPSTIFRHHPSNRAIPSILPFGACQRSREFQEKGIVEDELEELRS